MAGGYDGSIKIDTSIDSKGFNKGIAQMTGSVKSLAASVGVAFGVGAVVSFGKNAVDAASRMGDAFIGLESIMTGQGRSFETAKKFIDSFIADGLVPVTDAVTAYKNLASRGYDTTQIEKTLIALKDSASFGRQAALSIGEAVKGATEGLKNENSILVDNAGVTKNVSIMWKEYAASIGTTVNALTKEQKIQAEVAGIMNETRFQTGDAAKAAGTYSGQIAALGVSFNNLKVAIGNIIIPIIQKVLPYIRMAVDALVFFFNQVAQIVNLLLGTNIGAATAQTQSMAAANEAVADSGQAAAGGQKKLADETKKAGKAAKGSLAAFDQLNVLQQDMSQPDTGPDVTGGAGGAGAGAGAALPGLGELGVDGGVMDTLADKAAKVREFLQPLTDAFLRLRDALIPLGKTIWEGLMWAWENILVPLGTWVITELLPRFLDILAISLDNLNLAIEAVKPQAIWLWDNFLKPAAEWTGDAIIAGLDWVIERLKDLNEWIGNNKDAFAAIVAIIAIVIAILLLMSSPIALVIAGIALIIAIIVNWGAIWDFIKQKSLEAWETIVLIFAIAGIWFENNVTKPIKDAFDTALTDIKARFTAVFEGIKGIVKDVINSIIDMINSMLGSLAGGMNGIITSINAVGGKIPGFSPISTVTAPQIPRLATGAVIPPNAEFAAILGDQRSGRNIEAPEGLIRQIVREEVGAINANISIDFRGSLAGLVRELKPYIDKENVRIGGSLIKSTGGLA